MIVDAALDMKGKTLEEMSTYFEGIVGGYPAGGESHIHLEEVSHPEPSGDVALGEASRLDRASAEPDSALRP